jgi:hypothetical protein
LIPPPPSVGRVEIDGELAAIATEPLLGTGRPLECHGLLLLRWLVRPGLTALLGIPLPRRLILLVRLLVLALPLVLL